MRTGCKLIAENHVKLVTGSRYNRLKDASTTTGTAIGGQRSESATGIQCLCTSIASKRVTYAIMCRAWTTERLKTANMPLRGRVGITIQSKMSVEKRAVTVSTTEEKICSIWSATTIPAVEQAQIRRTSVTRVKAGETGCLITARNCVATANLGILAR